MLIKNQSGWLNTFELSNYNIVSYQFVDDFRGFRPLSECADDFDGPLSGPTEKEKITLIEDLRSRLAAAFLAKGWEGDGEINVTFAPPFLCDTGETSCVAIFHVKQSNNGISYVAFPSGVKFGAASGMLGQA